MHPQLARIFWERSAGCFISSFVIQVISEKTLWNKSFTGNLRDKNNHENNRNYNSYRFSYKFTFILFLLSFLTNQKQELGFQQVGRLVTRNYCFLFIESRTLLQSHAKFKRLFWRNFLTCYSCSYYSSMII